MREETKNKILLVLAVVLSSLPLLFYGIEGHFGQDLGFHLNRIEGIYLELKNGVFPVRMQSFWMDGYGYPVSIYYGDTLLYIPALLRLLGLPVVTAYKAYILFINCFTAWVSYVCFQKMTFKKYAAVGAFVYVTGNYRLLNLYIRAAVGEYTAMMFLPLIALAVYEIYYVDVKDKDYKKAIIPLVIGMSGILESHMMTLEMVGLVLIVICILNIKKTFRKETLLVYIESAGVTLLLNLYFILPFLDYFFTENVRINQVVSNARAIQQSGAYIWEYFAFFMIPFSNLDTDITSDRMSVTPGIIFIATVFVALFLWVRKKADGKIKRLTIASLILLFLASNLFPWDFLAAHTRVGNFLAQVQFPWRYIGIFGVIASILLLLLLEQSKKNITILIVAVSCVMCLWFAGVYKTYAELDTFATTEDLDTYDMGFIEYLRPDAVREEFAKTVVVKSGDATVTETYRKGTTICYEVTAKEDSTIELPIMHYKYYYLRDNNGNEYELFDGTGDVISFKVDAGFWGTLTLTYEEPRSWRVAELVSLITLILCFLWFLRKRLESQKVARI